jgi:metallo-beta-lactamase family protein
LTKITTFGAAGEVTGSCHLLEEGGYRILLDCGLFQGERRDEKRNREPFPFEPASVDVLVLSHAHIDHCGRIPLLVKAGFKGPIYTHRASRDLCRIMLKDSASLHEHDAEWENRKRARKGLAPFEPLYTMADAEATMTRFKAMGYGVRRRILPGVSLRLADAGHILGSSIIELWLGEGRTRRKLVYSGDLGHNGAPILRDIATIAEADLVVMESTYGDRLHRSLDETLTEVGAVLTQADRSKGNILVPAFALGRCQELLYLFGKHYQEWRMDRWSIFLDSPMAIQVTAVYLSHSELYDEEAAALWRRDRRHPLLPNLHPSRTASQSMAINEVSSGAIIIAGSGMCTGGRIKHHLKHNLWRDDCHIIIPGFQARGTPGRALVDGARFIRLWDETVRVAARIHTIGGLSAHADQDGLVGWRAHIPRDTPTVLVHGEPTAQACLAERLRGELGAPVRIANAGESFEL